ncbi:hypothetical protein AGOR_G00191350 [Albula goreensis]|uniref:Uncharacterized protein n=1 Tax=Albula goreensis TaxID=1534307 RepID=A0A8T3CQP7_9TELE|nr:hypothetical protein AGOR_G00191350 [Albula goreensis]
MLRITIVMFFIGLCASLPASDENERTKRSISDENFGFGFGGGFGGYFPYQSFPYNPYVGRRNNGLLSILPFILARLIPTTAPLVAPTDLEN